MLFRSEAEGILSTDGTSFNRSFVGTPGDPAIGDHAEWVQVLAPLGRRTPSAKGQFEDRDGRHMRIGVGRNEGQYTGVGFWPRKFAQDIRVQ